MKKKKVMFLIQEPSGGGAEKVIVDILNNIDTEKLDITLNVIYKEGIHLDQIKSDIKINYLIKDKYIKYKKIINKIYIKYFSKTFYKRFIKDNYDVEIAFLEGAATKVIGNSTNNYSKKIAWVHTDLLNFHWTKQFYKINEESKVYDKFNEIVFVSKDAKESFKKLFIQNKSNKSVIYNPVIQNQIIEKSKLFDIKYDKLTLISVGRLIDVKGFDRLIKVHSKVVKKFNHNLVILGDGPEKQKLQNLIEDLGVKDTVKLEGFKLNPYPYIKASDIFVCSSKVEGYPMAVLEAICLEKPILSTNITGPREILDEGKFGILCDNSEEGLETKILEIISDTHKINYLKEQSKKRKKDFDYNKVINDIEKIILT